MRLRILTLGCSFLLLTFGACGGDETGQTSGTGTTGGGPSPAVLDACDKYCNVKVAAGCETAEECSKSCEETAGVSTFCDPSFVAYTACSTDELTVTGQCQGSVDGPCKDEFQAWFMCISLMGCSELGGSGTSSTCTQEGVCDGVAYKAECSGTMCSCFKANALAGTCVANDERCNIREGCCSAFFFP
jgi:hypothetical protein